MKIAKCDYIFSKRKDIMVDKTYYKGKALVVGNDHYDQVKPNLDNAVNDARGIYEAFRELGFMMMPEAYIQDMSEIKNRV